jgi:hypothetical protein
MYKNALWVNRNAKLQEKADKLNMHYVFIEGTFDARSHGHGGLFAGAMTNIVSARIAPDRKP